MSWEHMLKCLQAFRKSVFKVYSNIFDLRILNIKPQFISRKRIFCIKIIDIVKFCI